MTQPRGTSDAAQDAEHGGGGVLAKSLPVVAAAPEPEQAYAACDDAIAERLALLEDKVERALVAQRFDDDVKDDDANTNARPDDAHLRDGAMELPQSTYTLLITEDKCGSAASILAIVTAGLSMTCLILALIYSFSMGTMLNPLGLPVDVSPIVRGAQFLGVFIGVLMEDEIPCGLELIAISTQSSFLLNDKSLVHKRVLFSSTLRLLVGYMFLTALFVNVVQTDDVLNVFFDVLALQFVESIDDVAFNLAKRGFFGSRNMKATQKKHSLQAVGERGIASKSWVHRFARGVYYLNAVVLLSGLVVISVKQHNGDYRCRSLSVTFDEVIWESAHITLPKGTGNDVSSDPWLLAYPYFSGTYMEDGSFNGYPRYREASKNGGIYRRTVGAEFVYCKEIQAWVFRHEKIRTSLIEEKENECSWLARSQETQEFDLLSLEGKWSVWTGKVENVYIEMSCNECWELSDCNYHGKCVEKQCACLDDYFGDQCQFEVPCPMLKSKLGDGSDVLSLAADKTDFKKVYNRPVYMLSGLTTSSPTSENSMSFLFGSDFNATEQDALAPPFSELKNASMAMVLSYSGSRWYGSMMPEGAAAKFMDDQSEYHGFWSMAFARDNTMIVSETTFEGHPESSDFFRPQISSGEGAQHGAYGILTPLADYEGSGFFVCVDENDFDGSSTALPDATSEAAAPLTFPSKEMSNSMNHSAAGGGKR